MSGKAIEILNDLARVIHFPASSRLIHGLNPLVRGLLSKYRLMFSTYNDINGSGKGDILSLQATIASLQNDIVNLVKEKNEALNDRDQALEVLDLIRMKYQSLLNDKILANRNLLKVKQHHRHPILLSLMFCRRKRTESISLRS